MRTLFSIFSDNHIKYSQARDFNQTGDFPAYWKQTFASAQQHRSDYGTKPQRSTFDNQWRATREKALKDGKLKPLTNYDHHSWFLLEEFLTHNMLRASQEPTSICRSDLEHGIMPADSEFAGRKFYKLKPSHSGQKGNALRLKNTSTENGKNTNAYMPMVDEPPGDPFSLYRLLDRHLNVYLPPQHLCSNGRIFRRRASVNQIEVTLMLSSLCLVAVAVITVDVSPIPDLGSVFLFHLHQEWKQFL